MTDSRSIFRIFIVCVTLVFAVWLGVGIITDQIETLIFLIGGATLLTCALLGNKIWLLVPFMAALNVSLRIPGQPTSLLLAQAIVLGFSILLFLMRKLPVKFKFTELEFWTILLCAFVLQVYLRNPVSVSLFGGSMIGGKTYIIFAITVSVYILFSGLRVPVNELHLFYRLTIIGGILSCGLNVIGRLVPSIGVWYGASPGSNLDQMSAGPTAHRATRIGFLNDLASNLSLWICTRMSPFAALVRPIWLFAICLSLGFAAMSGFRNTVAAVGMTYICGLIYRGGGLHLLASFFSGVILLALLAFANLYKPLPPNMQRSLSFLPGTWDDDIKRDAKNSTEWRTDIWKEVLFTDRWISNKYFGDGLGFTARELQTQLNLSTQVGVVGISGFDMHRETILSNADYHSGPVATIRTIGYIGLLALLLAMIRLSVHAHRQIKRAQGTEWFPLALLICIPLIWMPFFFVFVFGSFQIGATGFLLGSAMVRLLENNLPLLPYSSRIRDHVYLPPKNPSIQAQA